MVVYGCACTHPVLLFNNTPLPIFALLLLDQLFKLSHTFILFFCHDLKDARLKVSNLVSLIVRHNFTFVCVRVRERERCNVSTRIITHIYKPCSATENEFRENRDSLSPNPYPLTSKSALGPGSFLLLAFVLAPFNFVGWEMEKIEKKRR